jgi:hypothetical protein
MLSPRVKASVIAAFLALVSPILLGNTTRLDNLSVRVLAAHNRERSDLGVPPVEWNASLAADAQRWADELAASGRFEHAPEDPRAPEGENIWAGTRGYYSIENMVDAWVREKKYFKPGLFPNNSVTGHVSDVGHFTQLAWHDTLKVGCATAQSGVEDILVCRYSRPGNYIGERPF